ncbi:Alpha/Beta hydrolase protein, partial [Dimargaris cristalligena]
TSAAAPIVMLHGFGGGLGIYFRNYAPLAEATPQRVIYSVDWIGMGLSSRSETLPTSKGEVVAQTEDFFIDALERWRLTMGIPQMYLMAHSFGAYMAALYANRYPHRVERLVLLSPMGVSPTPPGYDAWVREILQGNFNCPLPRWAFKRPTAPKLPAGFRLVPLDNDPEARLHLPGAPESFLGSLRLHGPFFYHIWRWNLSPQWFVRATGPLGPTLITRFSTHRHHSADLAQQRYLEYIYHLAAQPASGEYAYTALLTPYAFARAPLTPHRLAAVTSPVTIVYGEHDWINHGGAEELIQHLPTGSRVTYLPGARHSSMVEQPDQFNAFMREELTLTAKSESSPRP